YRRRPRQRTHARYGAGQRSNQPQTVPSVVWCRDQPRISSRSALTLLRAKHRPLHAAAERVARAGGRSHRFVGSRAGRRARLIVGMPCSQYKILLSGLFFLSPLPLLADRKPVLGQIQLPPTYYSREMYLPQLTTGPSALTFSPDGKELVYSMGGSLWRQTIGSEQAREITHATGYDYQPDWSHDGQHIIFTRYQNDALELWQLNLQTGKEIALTSQGDVNVEPRYSPNDRQIAFVSTTDSGHFNLYLAEVSDDQLSGARRLVPEHTSHVYRY